MKENIYDPEDPDRIEFLRENVVAIIQQKDEEILRQKRALTKLEEQNAGLRARKSWVALVREFHETFALPIRGRTLTFNREEIILRAELIREEFEELLTALGYGHTESMDALEEIIKRGPIYDVDAIGVADALGDLAVVDIGAAFVFGINIDPIFREIHASNMSKLGEDGKPLYRQDGKVLKGPNFFEPDISKHLSFRSIHEGKSRGGDTT